MTARIIAFPLDVDAIAARAEAAPGGTWEAFTDSLWLPWHAEGDDDTDGHWSCAGRWLAVREHGWHTGSEDPPPELWTFLAAARDDVLSLAAEVRRLRAELADARARRRPASQPPAPAPVVVRLRPGGDAA
jgi:hypothetical protein